MTAERWTKVRVLVERALAFSPESRSSFLAEECIDADLIAEAERLLAYDHQSTAIFGIEGWQQRATKTAADTNIAGTLTGSYRLLEELGRGGMGTVYLAERADGAYQQKVAIKILQENIYTPALAARFRQERQILAQLSHPGIVRLLDGGVMPDGRPYLVMEFVDGRPIDRYCDENQLNTEARLQLFLRVADVVQSAHQQLVLHLDLKPANILVTAEGEPQLLDFGIARMLGAGEGGVQQTHGTLRLLTPRYASPEQATGAPLGVASDVFSLATLLYRLLTGRLPYPIENAAPLEAARLLREAPPMVPSQAAADAARPGLRGDLDTILLQALRKEPERRYPTVAAFADDVKRHLTAQPVHAHADSFGYRTSKFVRRNRVSVVAAGVVIVILGGSMAAVTHSAIVARRERANAELERATAERRLKDVRALAHSYVFDLDPKLENIPGTIGVRHFVLQNAQKYLEAMSQESGEDDDLARETAQGYSQIADVQETLAMPSLGDEAAAEISINKGLAIQQHLVEKYPLDVKERLSLLRQMQHLATSYAYKGDISRGLRVIQKTWEVGQPLRLVHPTPDRFTDLAAIAWDVAWMNCGNGDLWNLADPVAAIPWLDQAQQIAEQHNAAHSDEIAKARVYSILERVTISRAAILAQVGRGSEARPLYEQALKMTTWTLHSINEEEMRRQIRGYYAAYLLSVHDIKGAEALAPLLMPASFHEKGGDRLLTSDEADELTLLARIDIEGGHLESGRRRMKAGLGKLEALYQSAPSDAGVSSELAWDGFRLAEEKRLDNAIRKRLYQRSIEIAKTYSAAHPDVLSAALLAGKCELGLAEIAGASHNKDEQQTRAAASIEQFSRVLAAHPIQPEASALLARARAFSAT